MNTEINFITTCGGNYDMIYANKAHKMLSRNLKIPFKSYCITERPSELIPEITPIAPLIDRVKGWWNKIFTFSNEMPNGYILVLDIDLLIINDLTQEISYAIENLKEIACYSDAIGWEGSKFSSSMMLFKSGTLNHIYQNFLENYPAIEGFKGGDQVWTYPQLKEILYLDEIYPNFKKSLKFQLGTIVNGSLTIPQEVNNEIKIIDCHGRPKPHEITNWEVVKKHWR